MLVDTLGLVLAVVVTEANLSERLGGCVVVMEVQDWLKQLQVLWVDAGYQGKNFARVIEQLCGATVEVIKRTQPAFEILPKRWIVERTFAWLNQYRRLSKDYELLPEVSETMIYASMSRLMLKRLTKYKTEET